MVSTGRLFKHPNSCLENNQPFMLKNVAYLNHCSTHLYIRLVADFKRGTEIIDDDQRSGPELIKPFHVQLN